MFIQGNFLRSLSCPPAPFIALFFGAQLPHIDYLVVNGAGARALTGANGLPDPKDLSAVTKALA